MTGPTKRSGLGAALGAIGPVIGLLMGLVLVVGAGLWGWAGTSASVEWAWQRWAVPAGWQAQQLQGSLREGVRARQITFVRGDLRLQAQEVTVTWQLLSLLQRRLHLTRMHMTTLQLQMLASPSDGPPPHPPDALIVPWPVSIEEVAIGALVWHRDAEPATGANRSDDFGKALTAQALRARYAYDTRQHRLWLHHLQADHLSVQGEAQLGDRDGLPFDLRLQARRVSPARPAPASADSLEVRLRGPLADLAVTAHWQGRRGAQPAGRMHLASRLTPWQTVRWHPVRLLLQDVDAAALWPSTLTDAWPGTAISGTLVATPHPDAAWTVQADLSNARSGPWDTGRLPVAQLRLRGRWHESQAVVQALHARIGQGTVQGEGRWLGAQRWQWRARAAGLTLADLHRGLVRQPLDAELALAATAGVFDVQALVQAPGLQARVQGRLGAHEGRGEASLRLTDAVLAPSWREGRHLAGQAALDLTWSDGWRAPDLRLRWASSATGWPGAPLRRLQLLGQADARRQGEVWIGQLHALQAQVTHASGTGSLRLQAPIGLRREAHGLLELGAGRAVIDLGTGDPASHLAWDTTQWNPSDPDGRLRTRGQLLGLPLRALQALLRPNTPRLPEDSPVFDGQWDLRWGDGLVPRLQLALARARGDLSVLAETAEGFTTRVAAGVRAAGIWLDSDGQTLTARLRWDSERAGQAQGQLTTVLSPGGPWGRRWTDTAPLQGRLQARLPRLAVWSLLAPAGWRLRGTLSADIGIGGNRGQPQIAGTVQADRLGLRSVVEGIALQDGRLRARLDGRRLWIDELSLQGPGEGGQLLAQGEAIWPAGAGWRVLLQARLDRLRASVRADRAVTASGHLRTTLDAERLQLEANLRIDQARIVLPDRATPALSPDVVVRGLPADRGLGAGHGRPLRPWQVKARVDLGNDFRVTGRGADLRLRGAVDVQAQAGASPRLAGTVRTADGTFRAWGQRLVLERGLVRFTGPADDPALDLLAVRPDPVQREAVRVGLQVKGTGRAPQVRLWSEPELPEAQKLSWLLLGRPAASAGAETALLEDAALSLLAGRTGAAGGRWARRLGLDELGLRRQDTEGTALTLGKRLSEDLYATYERSLSGALGTLRVFYDLTRHLTLRAQAGERSGVDLVYTLSHD